MFFIITQKSILKLTNPIICLSTQYKYIIYKYVKLSSYFIVRFVDFWDIISWVVGVLDCIGLLEGGDWGIGGFGANDW